MKTALSMEGGAMRGMFTCGVIDVLMENGITFDAAAGISAGAAFGCNYKSRQIGRPIRYNKRYGSDPRYMSFRSLLKTGDLYNADFCYRELPDVLDPFDRKAFRDNPMAFYIGATDVKTGKSVYHLCSDGEERDILWMRASASMPLVSRPVDVDGYLLLDGGITDPVPLDHMQSLGFDRHVVMSGMPFITGRWMRSTGRRRKAASLSFGRLSHWASTGRKSVRRSCNGCIRPAGGRLKPGCRR